MAPRALSPFVEYVTLEPVDADAGIRAYSAFWVELTELPGDGGTAPSRD
jgi:hypothetical protein